MADTSATIHVTKLTAAQRQLAAAVRMFFSAEDELAIHTVAAAAYRLLSDLKASRGRDEVADYYCTSIFYVVRSFRRGKLPKYLADDPEAMRWIQELAEQLPITADSKFEDVSVSISPKTAQKFWRNQNSVANFLKHADRDPRSHIALDEVDNLRLLMQSLSAYVDLVHDQLDGEGRILWVYFNVVSGEIDGMPAEWQEIARKLEKLQPDERLRLCAALVREWNSTG